MASLCTGLPTGLMGEDERESRTLWIDATLESKIEGWEVNLLELFNSSIAVFMSLLFRKDMMTRVSEPLVYGVLQYIPA